MDKKWSEIGKLKKITNEIINICSLIENNNGDYTNKLIEVNVLFQPLIKEINEIKEELRTIKSSDGESYIVVDNDEGWWNENYGKNKIPNLSIAIDLLNQIKELSENVLYKTDLGITVAQQSQVDILRSNINTLSNSLTNLLKTLTWLQDVVVYQSQIENNFVDDPNSVASAQSVWNLYNMIKDFDGDCDCAYCLKQEDIGKTVASYDSVVELYNLLGKPEIHFDTTVVDDSQVEKEEDHIVINIEERAVFMPDNNVYKRVNFSEDEIKTWIQYHNNTFKNPESRILNSEVHPYFNGKFIGEAIGTKTKKFTERKDILEKSVKISTNERFNDYENNTITDGIENYSSIHNVNNKIDYFNETFYVKFKQGIYKGTPSSSGDASDCYGWELELYDVNKNPINVDDYVGMYIKFDENYELYSHSSSITNLNTFLIHPRVSEFESEVFNVFAIASKKVDDNECDFIKYAHNPKSFWSDGWEFFIDLNFKYTEFIEVKISSNPKDEYTIDSYFSNPCFITGKGNRSIQGNQTIVGKYNFPSRSIFIVGNGEANDYYWDSGSSNHRDCFRRNAFEITEDDFIYGWVNMSNGEVKTKLYINISEMLSDLHSTLLYQAEQIKALEEEIKQLKNG